MLDMAFHGEGQELPVTDLYTPSTIQPRHARDNEVPGIDGFPHTTAIYAAEEDSLAQNQTFKIKQRVDV